MKNFNRLIYLTLVLGLFVIFSGCAPKNTTRNPQFYPNDRLTQVGRAQANNDTRYCMSIADEYVQQPDHFKKVAGSTLEGAVVGAGAGAVGGAIVSKAGRGTGIGAASGAIIGLYKGLKEAGKPNPTWENFVEQCLADKGYKVYAWG